MGKKPPPRKPNPRLSDRVLEGSKISVNCQLQAGFGPDLDQFAEDVRRVLLQEMRRTYLTGARVAPRRSRRLLPRSLRIKIIRPVFEPRDLWTGLYIGPTKRSGLLRYRYFYVCPVPMLVLRLYVEWLDD